MRQTDDLEDLSRRAARTQNQIDPTQAKRTPWFVGSNPRLMVAMLTLIALLIVVRLVSTVWLIEDAWTWWSRQTSMGPLSILQKPHGENLSNPAMWITADDYPPSAIRAHEQGIVRMQWQVTPDGRVSTCRIVRSSGFASLDAAACNAIVRRGRYPVVTPEMPTRTYTRRVVWVLPRN